MKVKLLTLMSGPEGIFHPGAVVDFPEEKAQALIEGGFAELVLAPKKPVETVETATESDNSADSDESSDQEETADEEESSSEGEDQTPETTSQSIETIETTEAKTVKNAKAKKK